MDTYTYRLRATERGDPFVDDLLSILATIRYQKLKTKNNKCTKSIGISATSSHFHFLPGRFRIVGSTPCARSPRVRLKPGCSAKLLLTLETGVKVSKRLVFSEWVG